MASTSRIDDPIGNARWWILALVSITLLGNYYVYDSIGPVADLLQRELGFNDTQVGALNAIYSLPNIVLVLVGGILADRLGAARVIIWTGLICLVGAALTASGTDFKTLAAGRLLFGIGAETQIVATMIPLARWFTGSMVAFAMALSLSVARVGSYAADLSPGFARNLYEQGWHAPLWLAAGFALLGFVAALLYGWVERRAEAAAAIPSPPSERIVWSDVIRFDRSYWYAIALCLLFYSAIFPFRSTFAIKYFQHVEGLSLDEAGLMNSHVFLAAIFATPAFGWLSDRIGRRALLLGFGSLLLTASFVLLGARTGMLWPVTVMLGISFSLVPAVIWPAVSYIVEPRRHGTAFGLMTMLQNIGLALGNLVAGGLNDAYGAGAGHPDGYRPMLWFFGVLSFTALGFAILLRLREQGPDGHGLEDIRPKTAQALRPEGAGEGAGPPA